MTSMKLPALVKIQDTGSDIWLICTEQGHPAPLP